MKKGFTLIELLAVIIILVVVSLISTPIIMDVIEDSRKSADRSAAHLVLSAANNYYAESMLDTNKQDKIKNEENLFYEIQMQNKPKEGTVYINEQGQVALVLVLNKTCYVKSYNTIIEEYDINSEECDLASVMDQVKPTVSLKIIEGTINNGWYIDDTYVEVKVEDDKSGFDSYKWCNGKDCEPTTIETENNTSKLLTDSANAQICVIGIDKAGNQSEKVCSNEIKIDKIAPTIELSNSLRIAQGMDLSTLTDHYNVKNNGVASIITTCVDTLTNTPITNTNALSIGSYNIICTTIKENGMSASDTMKLDIVANEKCVRATTLHTEICNMSHSSLDYYCGGAGYSKGSTITYGSLGDPGVLSSGDAFDCDVNGNGIYDDITERFYYVSDLYNTTSQTFNSNYATLIYYSDTYQGVASNESVHINYDSSGENWHGPRTGIVNLPTTTQWSNVSLSNTSRSIITETGATITNGGTLPTSFSYEGYAARLLTVQELNKACGITVGLQKIGELDTCNYLMENTIYSASGINGYWLETPYASNSISVWHMYGTHRSVFTPTGDGIGSSAAGYDGIRPAIEVLKSDISY